MSVLNNGVRCSILSLSGTGWLFPYHVGVIEVLEQNGVLKPSTPLQGLSGGAMIAAGFCSGVSADEMMDSAIKISTQLREVSASATTFGTVYSVWGKVERTMQEVYMGYVWHMRLDISAWGALTESLPLAACCRSCMKLCRWTHGKNVMDDLTFQ